MDDEHQPNLPLDERFRQAEQYSLVFEEAPKQQPAASTPEAHVCIGNCAICPHCDGR